MVWILGGSEFEVVIVVVEGEREWDSESIYFILVVVKWCREEEEEFFVERVVVVVWEGNEGVDVVEFVKRCV